jgi:O-antigen/teichoic acid export membrane protein
MASLFTLLKIIGYGFVLFTDKSLWTVLVVELIAYAVLFTGLQIVYRNKIPVDAGKLLGFSAPERKRLVRYAFFYNFNDAGSTILAPDFDNFIIAMYMNPLAVGAYAFCQRITKILQHLFPVSYLIEVIRPAFFTLGIGAGREQRILMFQLLVKITYIITIPLFIGVLFLGKDMIVIFFGGKFVEYSYVLSVIFFLAVLNAFQTPLGLAAMLKERMDIMLYSKIFAFYNIAADILLIPVLGLWGAVLATGTATLGKNLFVWFFVRKEASFSGMLGFFAALIAFWTITGASIWGLDRFFELSSTGQFISGALLITAGFLLQFRLGLFTQNEAGILQSAFSKYAYMRPVLKFLKV